MEDFLDIIAKGEKNYFDLCNKCLEEIKSINGTINKINRQEFIIDDHHTYMIGKHGPVVIKVYNEDKTNFLSVKKDIDIRKT